MNSKLKVSLLVLSSCLLASCGTTVSHEEKADEYEKTLSFHEGFVIVQLTDVHWSTGTDAMASRQYMDKVLAEIKAHYGKIDLIEFTGDEFMLSNVDTVVDFLAWAESLGIPYATTWGNHDIEGTYNPNWLSEQFLKAEHSLYAEVDNDDVHGRSNYVINLKKDDGTTAWQLAQLDSGASLTESAISPFRSYDYIREDQAAWWKYEHDKVGDDVPTIAYFHIAQKETVDAYEAYAQDPTSLPYSKFYKLESFGNSKLEAAKERSPFYELASQHGLKAEFMGHCHANDWTFDTKEGVTVGLGVKSNIELYYGTVDQEASKKVDLDETFDLIGASCVKLHEGGTFDLEHLYYNERSAGDFKKWVSYK